MRYLLDSNVFIEAKNRYYGFDVCPAFWDWLDRAHAAGTVFSIAKVYSELAGRGDELSEWIEAREHMFLTPDALLSAALSAVGQWTTLQQYTPAAVSEFLDSADYFLVAHAMAHNYTVVCHERPENSKKKVKIPNACMAHDVNFLSPFDMLRRERARFVLG